MKLHAHIGGLHGEVGGGELGHGGLDADIVQALVHQPGDIAQPELRLGKLGGEVGQHELDALEVRDAPAGLAARADIGHGVVEGGARDAERMGGDGRARLVERAEQHLQPLARPEHQVLPRHTHALEGERGGGACAQAELVLQPQHAYAGGLLLDGERRDRRAPVLDLRPFAEQHIDVRHVSVGDEGLGPVDDDVAAVRAEAGAHAGGVGAGVLLGDAERGEPAVGDARQDAALQLPAAEVDDGLDRVEHGRPHDAGRRAGPRHLVRRADIAGEGQAGPAIGLGDEHPVEFEFAHGGEVVPGEAGLRVEGGCGRGHHPFREALHGFQHRRFLVRQRFFEAGVETVEHGHWLMLCAPSITMVSPVR